MNNKYTFGVITKLPSNNEIGNMHSALLKRDYDSEKRSEEDGFVLRPHYRDIGDEDIDNIDDKDLAWVLLPVFELGEVLILDGPYGREVSGQARKPSKWFVECEYFSDLEEAVNKSKEVIREYTKELYTND